MKMKRFERVTHPVGQSWIAAHTVKLTIISLNSGGRANVEIDAANGSAVYWTIRHAGFGDLTENQIFRYVRNRLGYAVTSKELHDIQRT